MSSKPPPHDQSGARQQSSRFVTGRVVAGRYEILERIGEGGTAEVFRARDHRLDRIVAVKVLRPQYGQDPDARARFAVEARTAAGLAVPNIVPVYDFGAADDGSLFIVMRYIDGPSLRRVLAEHGSLPTAQSVDVGQQIAAALGAAHGHGLIHRDVKPGNILLDATGTAHLTDFGVVKALAGADDLTRTGMTFGTAAYLAPEQATGGAVGPRTDLYALGAVLYEALAGRPPFAGDDPMTVSYRHVHEAPRPLRALLPDVDPDLERLVMQCLEKDPDRRPRSAEEVAARLGQIAGPLRSTAAGRTGSLAAVAGSTPVTGLGPREAEKETVLIAPLPAASPTTVPMAAAPARARARNVELGTAPPARQMRGARARGRRGTDLGIPILLLALALVLVGSVIALPLLGPRDDAGVGVALPTRQPPTRAPTVAAVAPPTEAIETPPPPLATVTAAPVPTPPPVTAAPAPTPEPTPERTRRPTPERTPEPTPVAPPPAEEVSVRIPNRLFVGDYDGPGSGRYHGRTASWVYGQGTAYDTMTAEFELTHEGQVGRRASVEIVGLDDEKARKNSIAVVFNGVTLYEGPNPLPNDHCCGSAGPGNWGSVLFRIPGELLRRNNELTVVNLESTGCTLCPNFVMVDYAELQYRVRP